jgi:phosphate transport system ATP-binding protein
MAKSIFSVQKLDFYYGSAKALNNINLNIQQRKVTALIGPSGCGKSTFLRCLNRMNDTIPGTRVLGTILLDDEDIYRPGSMLLHSGNVSEWYSKPNPFLHVYDNAAFGPRVLTD